MGGGRGGLYSEWRKRTVERIYLVTEFAESKGMHLLTVATFLLWVQLFNSFNPLELKLFEKTNLMGICPGVRAKLV